MHLPLPTLAVLQGPSGKLTYQRQFVEVRYVVGTACMPHNPPNEKHRFLLGRIYRVFFFSWPKGLWKYNETGKQFNTHRKSGTPVLHSLLGIHTKKLKLHNAAHSVIYFLCSWKQHEKKLNETFIFNMSYQRMNNKKDSNQKTKTKERKRWIKKTK